MKEVRATGFTTQIGENYTPDMARQRQIKEMLKTMPKHSSGRVVLKSNDIFFSDGPIEERFTQPSVGIGIISDKKPHEFYGSWRIILGEDLNRWLIPDEREYYLVVEASDSKIYYMAMNPSTGAIQSWQETGRQLSYANPTPLLKAPNS
jgi:hypothetical protein